MTEPAPSQGEHDWHDQYNKLRLLWQELADKATKIADAKFDMGTKIAKLEQQLTAERARADAAEAENKRLREAITSKHDTPSSLIEGLRAYAASTQNAEKAWHTTMADKLEAAMHQPERSEP